jgi:hypothetical protein
MSKNLGVLDTKPYNSSVRDFKPNNLQALDSKSSNMAPTSPAETERFYTVNIAKGQWMGFGALTYPVAFTVNSSKSP